MDIKKILTGMNTVDAMEFLLDKIKGTKTNKEFLESMGK